MRIGTLIAVDPVLGYGKIIDENEQEIHCCLFDLNDNIHPGTQLQFDIVLTAYGLTAVHIQWAATTEIASDQFISHHL